MTPATGWQVADTHCSCSQRGEVRDAERTFHASRADGGCSIRGTLEAQGRRAPPPRGHIGFNAVVAEPQGEFGDFVGTGYGLSLNGPLQS